MKRQYIYICILLAIFLLMLTGCHRKDYEKEWNRYDSMIKALIPALTSGDSERVFPLISSQLLSEDVRQSVTNMMECVEGDILDWKYHPASFHVCSSRNGLHIRHCSSSAVILTTSEGSFYIRIDAITTNTANPDSVGIVSIAICKYEELYSDDIVSAFSNLVKEKDPYFCFLTSESGYGYLKGAPTGNELITREEALSRSYSYLITICNETMDHLESMEVEVGYNISYRHDGREPTWHVEFWEYCEDSNTLSLCYSLEVNTTTGFIQLEVCGNPSFGKTRLEP